MFEGITRFFKEKIVNPIKLDKHGIKQVDKAENSLKGIIPYCSNNWRNDSVWYIMILARCFT